MGFWAYMLHCADRSFYIGHTDDLDVRIGAHQSGLIPGYTSTRLPVTLVWSDEFPSRYEALQAERRLKGWSRAKKLALFGATGSRSARWPAIRRRRRGLRQAQPERDRISPERSYQSSRSP
jgi:predicted GIY-YIG superfamily endonuclease